MLPLSFFSHRAPAQTAKPASSRHVSVIVISVDTLRADYLSCYNPHRAPTPHIDLLSRKGTLFSQAASTYPLTLPSHAALFTSTYPESLGVRENGVPLPPTAVTLASVLKNAGYKTSAFVSSFVLDRRFGLDKGFDTYDSPVDLRSASALPVERKRHGADTAAAALQWLDRNSSSPFFLFLHLYDLHLPYDLPSGGAHHGPAGYSAALQYEDHVLGDFLNALQQRHLFDQSLIIFTSDHGEGLGDHLETTHGYFVYQSTLHVPLIIHWPSGFSRMPPARAADPVSLLDVAPTVLDVAGVSRPSSMRGQTLLTALPDRRVFSESVYAADHFGCAPLFSLRTGNYHYIQSVQPELYDLDKDPGEQQNIYSREPAQAAALAQKLSALRSSLPVGKDGAARPDSVEALRSLGYVSGSSPSAGYSSKIDPKTRIADFEQYLHALDQASANNLSEANTILELLARKLPALADIPYNLGLNLMHAGNYSQAVENFKRAINDSPSDAEAHYELGFCLFHQGESDSAARQFKAALALEPWFARPAEALAQISIQRHDYDQARNYLNRLLTIEPDSYTAHYNLGILAAMQQNWPEAEKQLLRATQAQPQTPGAHAALAKVYQQEGKTSQAEQEMNAIHAAQ